MISQRALRSLASKAASQPCLHHNLQQQQHWLVGARAASKLASTRRTPAPRAATLSYTPASADFLSKHSYHPSSQLPSATAAPHHGFGYGHNQHNQHQHQHHRAQAEAGSRADESSAKYGYTQAALTTMGLLLVSYSTASVANDVSSAALVSSADKDKAGLLQRLTHLPTTLAPTAALASAACLLSLSRALPASLPARISAVAVPLSMASFVLYIQPNLFARCRTTPDPTVCNHTALALCGTGSGVLAAGLAGAAISRLGLGSFMAGVASGGMGFAVACGGVAAALAAQGCAELGLSLDDSVVRFAPALLDSQVASNLAVAITATNVIGASLPVAAGRLACTVGLCYLVLCVEELSWMMDTIAQDKHKQDKLSRRLRQRHHRADRQL